MRVYFTNLGCKLNQAEMEALAREFVAAGHRIVRQLEEADLHVVNSCTVTHQAARDSRKVARRGHRANPQMKTVLTGCYAAAEPKTAAALAGVDLVVDNRHKSELLQRVHAAFSDLRPADSQPLETPYMPLDYGNARAAVKIEDGCNMRCSFCIIPTTRGRQQSRSPDAIVSEVGALSQGGFKEIVLTGVQISSYRSGSWRLFDLVQALLRRTQVRRLRLTSIAPWDFDLRLLGLVSKGRICRHFHLSLQSGSERTLRRMRRPYTPARFSRLLDRIRHRIPGVAITTDVIVGFPGETEAEAEESLAFVDACGFSRVHAFPYSERSGTPAAELPDPVPVPVRRRRMTEMLDLAARLQRRYVASRLGEVSEVLWEGARNGEWFGTTDNYIHTRMERTGRPESPSQLESVRLVARQRGICQAAPLTRQEGGATTA